MRVTPASAICPTKKWHILTASLHGLFLLLHVVLVVVMTRSIEKNVRVPLGQASEFWTTFIHIALQFFAIVYLACVLFISQKVFMQRILVTKQTLSTSHDQYASWLGLGSAFNSLLNQRTAKSNIRSLIVITIYLSASAIVKITTAALFQLVATPVPTTRLLTALSVLPEDDNYTRRGDNANDRPVLANLLSPALMISMNTSSDGTSALISTLGLNGNTLYDVIPVLPNITENVEVNSHTVRAQCQSFDYDKFPALSPEFDLAFPLSPLSLVETAAGYWGLTKKDSDTTDFWNANANSSKILFFASVFNMSDSTGASSSHILPLSNASFYFLDRHIDSMDSLSNQDVYVISPATSGTIPSCPKNLTAMTRGPNRSNWLGYASGFSFGLCQIDVVTSKAMVRGEQRTLVESVPRKNSSRWREASFPDPSMWIPHTMYSFNPVLGAGFSTFSTTFSCGLGESNGTIPKEFTRSSSLFEQFIADKLHLFAPPPSQANVSDQVAPWPTIMLHDFENALEDYVAAYLFTRQKSLEMMNGAPLPSSQVLIEAKMDVFMSQLTLRPLPVYAGLVTSIVMFAISIWFVITTPLKRTTLDGIGLLQMLWIGGSGLVGPVSKPTERKLRKSGVGMFLKLDEIGLRRRVLAKELESEDTEMSILRQQPTFESEV